MTKINNVSAPPVLFFIFILAYAINGLVSAQSAPSARSGRMARSATSQVLISAKIFLEGAYRNGGMDDTLADNGLVPTTSPYSDGRSAASVGAGIIDWIFVQLLLDTEGPVAEQRSFFLHQNGDLIDPDDLGTELVIPGVEEGDYYIKIIHRTHLYVQTSEPVHLTGDAAAIIDCTSGASLCFGFNGMKEIAAGVWGMWCGEINGDDLINDADFSLWQQSARDGDAGYRMTDLNLDGKVTSKDYLFIYRNRKMDVRRCQTWLGEN
jgi:hypothetical protein